MMRKLIFSALVCVSVVQFSRLSGSESWKALAANGRATWSNSGIRVCSVAPAISEADGGHAYRVVLSVNSRRLGEQLEVGNGRILALAVAGDDSPGCL